MPLFQTVALKQAASMTKWKLELSENGNQSEFGEDSNANLMYSICKYCIGEHGELNKH